jgi:hypothetical protein
VAPLDRDLRKKLGDVVASAREVAEDAARKALKILAVDAADQHAGMTDRQKALRNRLRAHGRQLGDGRNASKGTQDIEHLVAECAYEHWHRMLFARFLLETQLLLEPDSGVSISFDEVKALARERGQDWAGLAGVFAVRMLPQVFRQDDPVLDVQFAPEDRKLLEALLVSLPAGVFTCDDSLGWTYQFWQAKERDAINDSGEKIGAGTIGPVTQLFTEHYMVEFLLHNTLGAWWAGRVLAATPELSTMASTEGELRDACAVNGVCWTYLRFGREDDGRWRPVAGTFDGWPKTAKEITVLDPCMGSGHFLIAALPILAALRAAEENLPLKDAFSAVLQDNLVGLELDARCTQIAAFNLALTAWKVTGYKPIPPLQLACSGVGPNVSEKEWTALAGRDERLRGGMARLHALFKDAPSLGSLINPRAAEGDLLVAAFHELEPLLERALAKEATDESVHELTVSARGLAKAAEILTRRFTLVATNVPYLGRGKQDPLLRQHCEQAYPAAKADLSTCFVERALNFCSLGGSVALVTPQNWWFLSSYRAFRQFVLDKETVHFLTTLGEEAWQSFGDRGPLTALFVATRGQHQTLARVSAIDALSPKTVEAKVTQLLTGGVLRLAQDDLRRNPDSRLAFQSIDSGKLLSRYCESWQGLVTTDNPRFMLAFWEAWGNGWEPFISSPTRTRPYGGRENVVRWMGGAGALHADGKAHNFPPDSALTRKGILVSQVRSLAATIYTGEMFAHGSSPVIPSDERLLPALWCFLAGPEYQKAVRQIDKKPAVTNGSLLKVEFDLAHWKRIAADRFPDGLPKPSSADPSQWLFDGQPNGSDQPLQVAVARLLGYRWPRQIGARFVGCPSLAIDSLDGLSDDDGIVCLAATRGKPSATERLRDILAVAYGREWNAAVSQTLLAHTGNGAITLDNWLRDRFFEQHCALFHQRPFVWHIWDGEPDGFHALVNYHKLAAPGGDARKTLEKLTYTFLGDWIARQKSEQKQGKEGADAKVAAAMHLQGEFKKILAGEAPYDTFARWKPLHEQAIGWEPDINDGVRVNIRPFVTAKTLRGSSLFRKAPKTSWDKDRGNELQRPKRLFPWLWQWDQEAHDFAGGDHFDGKRWNSLHYSIGMKQRARADV